MIRHMYETSIIPRFGLLDPQKWRLEKYWNEEVDNLYKSHFPILDFLFKRYGMKYMKPGDLRPFMMADEFEQLIMLCGFLGDELGTRDISVAFTQSMMTQVDEINIDKHIKAYFVEFLEAFARICDKLSIPEVYDEEVSTLSESFYRAENCL